MWLCAGDERAVFFFRNPERERKMPDEPVFLRLVLHEALQILVKCFIYLTLIPLAVALATHWLLTDDGTLFPWPIDVTVWWDGLLLTLYMLPVLGAPCLCIWVVERVSYAFLVCFFPCVLHWWAFDYVVNRWWRQILTTLAWTALLLPPVPLLVAWAHKLAWYTGNWYATGVWESGHVFVEDWHDAFLAATEHVGAAGFVTDTGPYRTVGMWPPDLEHWKLGAALLARCVGLTAVALLVLAPLYFLWTTAARRARRRLSHRHHHPVGLKSE